MLGTSKTVLEKAIREWEFLKIEVKDKEVLYTPFINGIKEKTFVLNQEKSNTSTLVFENFQNEFPKQIIYIKKATKLGIQLLGGSEAPTIQYDLPKVNCEK